MIHACETPGCGTLTMGQFCLACELELGIEFPRFTRRIALRWPTAYEPPQDQPDGRSTIAASVGMHQ